MVLVRHWLHQEPSDNWEDFQQQVRSAEWMENRFYDQLSTHIANKNR